MDGYTLSISRCSGGDGVEESFKAKIKRREAALDAFAVAEAYCKESWMASWMMYFVWNTAVASIRFRHAIGEFIHAFICRI